MFGKLAYEKHKQLVESDQLDLICEAADDSNGDASSEEIKMEELDKVIDSDAEVVTQDEIDKLENLIGEIAEDKTKNTDVSNMTKEEIEKHVASINASESISDLNT